MTGYSINRLRTIFLVCVTILVVGFFLFRAIKPTTNAYNSLTQAIKAEGIQKETIFNIVEGETYAYVQIIKGLDYQSKLFVKQTKDGQTRYVLQKEHTDEGFFSRTDSPIDVELEKKVLESIQEGPKIFQTERDIHILTTTNKEQLKLKINTKEADTVSKHDKNGVTFYFLIFETIDFNQKITVNL